MYLCVYEKLTRKMSLCGFAHTFSHVWMHAHTHAPAVPEAKIAAEEERNHSREGK